MVQHLKRRPLSRYLKDFKHSQTHCAHCRKLLDRITLVRDGKIVNKIEISRLDTLLDENGWQVEQQSWAALCRFCGDLHCKTQSDFFDIIEVSTLSASNVYRTCAEILQPACF